MDAENPQPAEVREGASPHHDLSPDQAVSLRPPAPALSQPEPTRQGMQPAPAVPSLPAGGFQAVDDEAAPLDQPGTADISWTASEFIAHAKSPLWYVALAAIGAALAALAYFLIHDLVTLAVIVICTGLFGYMASRQPRQLEYNLGSRGISVGPKFYAYQDFRSFAIVDAGAFSSIDFTPLKRFAPMLSIYYDPSHMPQIVDMLSQHLPMSHHKRTLIGDLMHRIRF